MIIPNMCLSFLSRLSPITGRSICIDTILILQDVEEGGANFTWSIAFHSWWYFRMFSYRTKHSNKEGSHLQVKERGLRKNKPANKFDLRFLASRIVRK